MKYSRRIFVSLFWVVLGVVLVGCCMAGLIDEFWNGMGVAFIVIGALQVIRQIKYRTNSEYRENLGVVYVVEEKILRSNVRKQC